MNSKGKCYITIGTLETFESRFVLNTEKLQKLNTAKNGTILKPQNRTLKSAQNRKTRLCTNFIKIGQNPFKFRYMKQTAIYINKYALLKSIYWANLQVLLEWESGNWSWKFSRTFHGVLQTLRRYSTACLQFCSSKLFFISI